MLTFQAHHIFLFLCLVFSQASASESPSVILGDVGTNACPEDYEKISDYRMCVAAMDILGPGNSDLNPAAFPAESFVEVELDEDFPSGCYSFDYFLNEGSVFFNQHSTGSEDSGATPICGKNLEPPKLGETLYVGDSDVDYWISRPSSIFDYNVGIGGYTCEDVVENVETYLDFFQPKTVVLVCGENDLASGSSVSKTSDRLLSAVERINEKGAAVIFMGTKNEPSTRLLWKKYGRYDDYARSLAETKCDGNNVAGRPKFTFIDVNAAFEDVGNPDSFYAPDQLHLSDEAYALWSEWVATAFNESACCSWQGNDCVNYAPLTGPPEEDDDDGEYVGDGCFSALNSVEVQGKGIVSMDSLEIGDHVRAGKEGEYSRVFSFGHLERDIEYDFLQIHTEGAAAPLELTKNHMVFRNNKAVRAEQVSVGDILGDNKVTEITSSKSIGLYAPITYDGSIVVNGIKSSCYVEMLDHVPVDQHHFVHMFFSLQRAACSADFGWCEQETYTNGLSDYSSWAIQIYMYCNNFSAPFQWFLTAICALILPTWYCAEQFFVSPILSIMAVGLLVYKSQTKKVKSA